MSVSYRIELKNRRMSLFLNGESGRDRVRLGDCDGTEPSGMPYRSLFVGLRRALEAVAEHAGYGRDGELEKMVEAFRSGDVELTLAGESREVAVAEFYLTHELELNDDRLKIEARNQPTSVYEDFGFAIQSEKLDKLDAIWSSFDELCETISIAQEDLERICESGQDYRRDETTFRVGVLGKTGAGKSTFINAIVGRRVLPLDSDVCTGTSIELSYAPTEEAEGVVPEFHPYEHYESLVQQTQEKIERLQSFAGGAKERIEGKEVYEIEVEIDEAKERLERLTEAAKVLEHTKDKEWGLEAVELFVDLQKQKNVVPELVKKVEVKLHNRILEHVTLVDTPGLRDSNENRRRAALNIVSNLDAWLYLIDAGEKHNSTVLDDLSEIREQANNVHGLLVFSKADTVDPPRRTTDGDQLDQLLSQRRREYGSKTNRRIPACSAADVERLSFAQALEEQGERKSEVGALYQGASETVKFLRRQVLPIADTTFQDDPIETAVQAHLKESYKRDSWLLIGDFLLENSRIIGSMWAFQHLLEDEVSGQHARKGRMTLSRNLKGLEEWFLERSGDTRNKLEALNDLQAARDLLWEQHDQLDEIKESIEQRKDIRSKLLEVFRKKLRAKSESRRRSKEEIKDAVNKKVKKVMDSKTAFYKIFGTYKINLFDIIDAPYAEKRNQFARDSSYNVWKEAFDLEEYDHGNKLKWALHGICENWEPHDSTTYSHNAEHGVFEWFETAVERATESIRKTISMRTKTIDRREDELLEELEQALETNLDEWIAPLLARRDQAADELEELRELVEDMENNVGDSRDELEDRLANYEADLKTLRTFADEHDLPSPENPENEAQFQWETPADAAPATNLEVQKAK